MEPSNHRETLKIFEERRIAPARLIPVHIRLGSLAPFIIPTGVLAHPISVLSLSDASSEPHKGAVSDNLDLTDLSK